MKPRILRTRLPNVSSSPSSNAPANTPARSSARYPTSAR